MLGGKAFYQQQTIQLREFTDFWYEPITSDNLPQVENNEVAVQDEIPVEVLEAEDEANLANFNVRKIFFTDFLPLISSFLFQAGISLGPVKVKTGLGVGR